MECGGKYDKIKPGMKKCNMNIYGTFYHLFITSNSGR